MYYLRWVGDSGGYWWWYYAKGGDGVKSKKIENLTQEMGVRSLLIWSPFNIYLYNWLKTQQMFNAIPPHWFLHQFLKSGKGTLCQWVGVIALPFQRVGARSLVISILGCKMPSKYTRKIFQVLYVKCVNLEKFKVSLKERKKINKKRLGIF